MLFRGISSSDDKCVPCLGARALTVMVYKPFCLSFLFAPLLSELDRRQTRQVAISCRQIGEENELARHFYGSYASVIKPIMDSHNRVYTFQFLIALEETYIYSNK